MFVFRLTNYFRGQNRKRNGLVQQTTLSDNKIKAILQKKIKMHKNLQKNMSGLGISNKRHFVRNITTQFSFCC